jgi:hypothetical protein
MTWIMLFTLNGLRKVIPESKARIDEVNQSAGSSDYALARSLALSKRLDTLGVKL